MKPKIFKGNKNLIRAFLKNENLKELNTEYISGLTLDDKELISISNKLSNNSPETLTEIQPRLNTDKEIFTKDVFIDRCISSYTSYGNSPKNFKKRLYNNDKNYKDNHSKNRHKHNSINRDSIFYHYSSKMPKRPFQKCIEVPSDYIPRKKKENKNKGIMDKKEKIDDEEIMGLNTIDNCNNDKRNILHDFSDNRNLSFDKKNQNNIKIDKYNEIEGDDRKKYFKSFFNNIKLYSKKPLTNICIASNNQNNNKIQKSNFISQKILKMTAKNKEFNLEHQLLELDSKVNNIFISASYNNPYREQFLKIINEKRKQNPDKIVELLIPEYNYSTNFINPFLNMYQFNPYISSNLSTQNFNLQNPMAQMNNNPFNNTISKISLNNNMNNITVSNNVNNTNPIQVIKKKIIKINDTSYHKKMLKQDQSNYNNYLNNINTINNEKINILNSDK